MDFIENKFKKILFKTNLYLARKTSAWNIKWDKTIVEVVNEPNHTANILAKMFNDQLLCDVILVAGLDQSR